MWMNGNTALFHGQIDRFPSVNAECNVKKSTNEHLSFFYVCLTLRNEKDVTELQIQFYICVLLKASSQHENVILIHV